MTHTVQQQTGQQQTDPNNPPTPKILVIGCGAVGGYYGAQLARAGAWVATVHRSDFEIVRAQGIQIDSMNGFYHFKPDQVLQKATDFTGYPDYILVGLKVLEEISTTEIIRPVVGPDTTIFLLQNGIEIEPAIAAAFPNNEILSGLAFICVSRTKPGHIQHTCYGRLTLGKYPSGFSTKATYLSQLFESVGTPCPASESIALERWKKLVWNAPFNPISVLSNTTTRQILEQPDSAQLVRWVMEEVCQVATKSGYPISDSVIQKNLDATVRMKPYKTSMLLDYLAGRPMEVEAILGNAIRKAREKKCLVPHMETLYALLLLLNKTLYPFNHETKM